MKKILTILFMLIVAASQGQNKKLITAMAQTRQMEMLVFETKDSVELDKLFAPELIYIHSSGKVQNRSEALHGIITNKSNYARSTIPWPYSNSQSGDSIIVTHVFEATETKADGTIAPLKISIEYVWAAVKKDLKLFRRKATKVE